MTRDASIEQTTEFPSEFVDTYRSYDFQSSVNVSLITNAFSKIDFVVWESYLKNPIFSKRNIRDD